jgi:glycosyltransferase involved in cell wall biosynthesis
MRIGLVVPGFSANAEDWCIPALRHLARALAVDNDIRVVAVRYPYRPRRYTIEGAEVIAVGGADRRGIAVLDVWRTTLGLLRAEHRRRPFDVLHAFWATESGLLTAIAGRLLHIPTLVSLAGGELVSLPAIRYGDQRVAWERLKVATSLRLASAVTAGSHQLLGVAKTHTGKERLYYAPLGVPLDLFSPCAQQVRAPRWIHVGTLTHVKDQATLLRAFTSLPAGAHLDIVGDGPLLHDLENLAMHLGVAQAVTFHGDVDHAALPDQYRQASHFVLSSLHEAQSMAAIEAAACGLHVVGTCVGVIPELTDTVAPTGNAEALATAMASKLENRAPEAAREKFGLDRCTQRFRDLYGSLNHARLTTV